MDQDLQQEPAFYEDFDVDVLEKIIKQHSAVVRRQKEKGQKKLYGLLVIVDDFADDASIMAKRSGSTLDSPWTEIRKTYFCPGDQSSNL